MSFPEETRKILEIRKAPVKFLSSGDRIVLISLPEVRFDGRQALAILEYECTVVISVSQFSRYYPLHRVTADEWQDFASKWNVNTVYGYQFRMVHVFPTPARFHFNFCEVWCWFALDVFTDSESTFSRTSSKRSLVDSQSAEEPLSAPSAKRQRPLQEKAQEEDVDSHSDDVQATPHGSQVCLVLMAAEWDALISGKERAILRPFQMHHGKTTIIVRNPEGHVVVGSVQWLESERFSHFSETRVAKLCSVVYKDTKQLAQMKQNKEKHIWKCKDVVAFKPYVARFLDVAPRYRNRPFIVKDQELFAHSSCDSFPKKLDLDDTARYFWSLLDEKMQLALRTTFRAVAKIRNTIRIGTTCSGTDVCIPVIKACVAFFNSLEAG